MGGLSLGPLRGRVGYDCLGGWGYLSMCVYKYMCVKDNETSKQEEIEHVNNDCLYLVLSFLFFVGDAWHNL